MEREILLAHIDKIHTTSMGKDRIRTNLGLDNSIDPVEYTISIVSSLESKITRTGKNYYIEFENKIFTINAYSYTIITAHLKK